MKIFNFNCIFIIFFAKDGYPFSGPRVMHDSGLRIYKRNYFPQFQIFRDYENFLNRNSP